MESFILLPWNIFYNNIQICNIVEHGRSSLVERRGGPRLDGITQSNISPNYEER